MEDQIVLNTDGLPVSLFSQFSTVLGLGPMSFPTQFMRGLAGALGWSTGYSRMGLNFLSQIRQRVVKLGKVVFKYIYRKPGGAQLKLPEDEIASPRIR